MAATWLMSRAGRGEGAKRGDASTMMGLNLVRWSPGGYLRLIYVVDLYQDMMNAVTRLTCLLNETLVRTLFACREKDWHVSQIDTLVLLRVCKK